MLLMSLMLICTDLFAQGNFATSKISIGFAMGFPTGIAAKTYIHGYGSSIQGEYNVSTALNLTGSAGYINFRYREDVIRQLDYIGEETSVSGVVPIKIGAKYYFEGIYYASAEMGIVNSLGKLHDRSLSYGSTLGVHLPFFENYGADLGLRYEVWNGKTERMPFFGMRAALAINLAK